MEVRKGCQVIGCRAPVVAKLMCDTHYRRVRDHGHAGPATPDRGERTTHRLYKSWHNVVRYHRRDCDPRWHDFWAFVADMEERPPDQCSLCRADPAKPWSKDNVYWRIATRTETDRAVRSAKIRKHQQGLRDANPDYFLDKDLRRHFGISLEQYRERLAQQNGVCAICRQPETMQINGRVVRLAVDHCHDQGHVRGLLCVKCNRGLGLFRSDPQLLLAAVEYLKGT